MQFVRTTNMDEVTLYVDSIQVGQFTVYNSNPWSLGIYVEEEWRGQGISRRLMRGLLDEWTSRNEYDPKRALYIDTDASVGFWDHIGMKTNPDAENKTVSHYGYEKCMTVGELSTFLLKKY